MVLVGLDGSVLSTDSAISRLANSYFFYFVNVFLFLVIMDEKIHIYIISTMKHSHAVVSFSRKHYYIMLSFSS